MKAAIFHDFLRVVGGAERVALTLARALGAPVYATDVDRSVLRNLGFEDVEVVDLGSTRYRPPAKQIRASRMFGAASAPGFDAYVISGNWAVHAARRHHPNLLYCYTPVRAFYDFRERTLRQQRGIARRAAVRGYTAFHRAWDRMAMANVDRIVSLSETTRDRVRRAFGRDSRVIYPPSEVARYRFEEVGDFWLAVNRLYPEKRPEIQFDAFRLLPDERLVVVGGAAKEDLDPRYLEKLDPPNNVEIRGAVPEEELRSLYARCRGAICTSEDEDYGYSPVEAMASGKITLAVDEGGFRETIVDGRTGWLLPADPRSFAEKIRALRVEDLASRRAECQARATMFDVAHFVEGMKEELGKLVRR
jgi:glycosyltransferase involved in cell wall biosynthesis